MAPYVVKAKILINASIDLILSINLDLVKYKEWNPFIVCLTNIPQQLAVGSDFTLHVRFVHSTKSTSKEKVMDLVPPYADASVGGMRRAMLAYKYTELLPSLEIVNGTRYQWLEQNAGSVRDDAVSHWGSVHGA